VSIWGVGCAERAEKSKDAPSVDSVLVTQVAADSIGVLDLLLAEHEVNYRGSAMGAFVTSVDSVETGGGCFWTFKVNDSAIPVACDKYRVGPGDTVTWRFGRGSR